MTRFFNAFFSLAAKPNLTDEHRPLSATRRGPRLVFAAMM
jgi:hypothetical protein